MKKSIMIAIAVVIIIAIIIVAVVFMNINKNTESKMQTTEQMKETFESIYTKLGEQLPAIQTSEIDLTDELTVKLSTGLNSTNNVESIVISEPLMNAQAYSAVMVKTSKDANIEEMKQEMLNNIDTRKWICVSAEKVYVTNNGNVIFLIMSNEEWATLVYNEFKNAVDGKVGKEIQRTEEI